MQTIKKFIRLAHINLTLMRHNLGEIITETHLFRPLRFIIFLNPYYWVSDKKPRGERLRLALQELGPIFVKFGQMLSTRRDILPPDIAEELSKLQDEVAPFPGPVAQLMIEQALGQPIQALFHQFDLTPLASASIAQVHSATLFSGEEVVIKVLRPAIEEIIRRDIELLYMIAGLAERYSRAGKRLKPLQVVAEFQKTLLDELDLVREAANASQLRRNHAQDPSVHIPQVYWQYTKNNILVLERIHGVSLRRLDILRQHGISMAQVAKTALHVFFAEVFENAFFHADLHAGNIFINIDQPSQPVLVLVDFGIVGSLSRPDQQYLAANLYAFLSRDYRRVAELHIQSGWVPAGTRVDEFESAIRSVCEPIFERPLKEVSLGEMLLRLIQVARRFHMEILPQLILLQKTLLNVEGMCRQLDPDFDLWGNMRPWLERWMRKNVGPKATLREIKSRFPQMSAQLLELPELLFQSLKRSQEKHEAEVIAIAEAAPSYSIKGAALLAFGCLNLGLFIGLGWGFPAFLSSPHSTFLLLALTTGVSGLFILLKRSYSLKI